VLTCLVNFLIAALMGLALRYTYISPIPLNYRFLTHAHSHVAMLGWVYLMLYVFIVQYFVPNKKPIYHKLFWFTELTVIGMMLSFPFTGYAVLSIIFSTLHIFCSYYFARLIWKNHKTESKASSYLLKLSLIFMVISTIGTWCLGPAGSMFGQGSAFFQISIQFFLHFQFNGWFLIAALTILFHKLKIKDSTEFKRFFNLLVVSTILTLALPVNWFLPHSSLLWINGLGILLQITSLYLFIKLIKKPYQLLINNSPKISKHLLHFSILCFILKTGLQTISIIPEISNTIFQHKNLVIGFIHLTMLGVISGFLLSYILQSKLVTQNRFLTSGLHIFILGFILTEVIIIAQGCLFYFGKGLLPNYYMLLFLSSILLPLGVLSLIYNIYKTKTT